MSLIAFKTGLHAKQVPQAEPIVREFRETDGQPTGYVMAVDLGQARDWSAAVVIERVEAERIEYRQYTKFEPGPAEYARRRMIRHNIVRLHRWPLGTSYPDICRSVRGVMSQLPPVRDAAELVADGTGVGRPVIDQFRELGLDPHCVTITGGFGVSGGRRDRRVAKKVLASTLDAVLSERRLKVSPADPLARVLVDELQSFTVRTTASGSEQFAALREKDHDDCVLATALAVWVGEQMRGPVSVNAAEVFAR